jgi:hypothetical protein
MIFYREISHQHYLYNGETVIPINPTQKEVWGNDGRSDNPIGKFTLDIALTGKVRGFSIHHLRYQIISRGEFVSE